MASSLDDVIRQMQQVGIDLGTRPVDLAKAFHGFVRWRPSCEKKAKKSAWARLFEYRSTSGRVYITGAFGYRGDKWDVEATATAWTPAERAEWAEQRKAAAKAAEAERAKDGETAAEKARRLWNAGREEGTSAYLDRKRVRAFGIRFGFNRRLMVPLRDVEGTLHGLQWISPDGEKIFGTGTIKEGRFHLIGEINPAKPLGFAEGYATAASCHMATGWPIVVCFDAGNLEPVVAAWRKLYPDLQLFVFGDDDRHLMQRLCGRLAKHGVSATPAELAKLDQEFEWTLPGAGDGGADKMVLLKAGWSKDAAGVPLIQGTLTVSGGAAPVSLGVDADGREISFGMPLGGSVEQLKLENAGRARATAVAKRFKGRTLFPVFDDASSPDTDWNDLHVAAGLDVVREQLRRAIDAPEAEKSRGNGAPPGGRRGGGREPPGDGDGKRYTNFLERYTLIYGTTTVWDAEVRDIIRVESLKLAHGKLVDWWLSHDERRMVDKDHVVFDPSGKLRAPEYVNLFDRLPIEPDPTASCARIVEHLWNICQENEALFHWVASWLALPLQQPGTKMRTALVLHGRTEGTGKTKLTEVMRRIYGRYSRSITQLQLQTEFTGWMSGQCFCVAEEVVSRQDRTHHKGLLQNLITNETVQINEKNMPLREERNHANFVFLSNDQIPMLLNPRDRRYTVIRVEREHGPEYFAALQAEIDNGGAAAFYAWLMKHDLQGFNAFTRPFENRDRMHLITLGMSPDQRFIEFWRTGLAGVPFCCCTARDLYRAFTAWCKVHGERYIANSTIFGRTVTEELERLGARPAKGKARLKVWSEKQIEEGDFSGEPSNQQGLVYYVPAAAERVDGNGDPPPDVPEGGAGPPGAAAPDLLDARVVSERVQAFQERLHELIRSARRSA